MLYRLAEYLLRTAERAESPPHASVWLLPLRLVNTDGWAAVDTLDLRLAGIGGLNRYLAGRRLALGWRPALLEDPPDEPPATAPSNADTSPEAPEHSSAPQLQWPITDETTLRVFLEGNDSPTHLILFEFSGALRGALLARGIKAISADFRDSETPGPHFRGDVRAIAPLKRWTGIFAVGPPCFQHLRRDTICLPFKLQDGRAFWAGALVLWCICLNNADFLCVEQPVGTRWRMTTSTSQRCRRSQSPNFEPHSAATSSANSSDSPPVTCSSKPSTGR